MLLIWNISTILHSPFQWCFAASEHRTRLPVVTTIPITIKNKATVHIRTQIFQCPFCKRAMNKMVNGFLLGSLHSLSFTRFCFRFSMFQFIFFMLLYVLFIEHAEFVRTTVLHAYIDLLLSHMSRLSANNSHNIQSRWTSDIEKPLTMKMKSFFFFFFRIVCVAL